MRRLLIDAIKGNEILAKDIMSEYDTLLMSKGITVKKEYISRLKDLNINYIYVEDEFARGINENEIIEMQIKEQCQKKVKETLDKYVHCGEGELKELKNVAQEIIFDLIEQPEIIFNVSGVRQKVESAYSHTLNVSALAVFLALRMKISRDKVKEIAIGSLLHDIGYNDVKVNFLNKKYEEFTEQEKREIKMHVIYGYSAIEQEKWLTKYAKEIILHHHECMDGSGYPLHITGEKMKIGTRIVCVCDEFDRLIYGNFSKGMKVHEAIEYIVSQGDIKFDLEVVKVFNASVAAYPNGTIVLTNENEIGIVLRQNSKCPTRPILRMIKDSQGNEYKEWEEKDLTKELTLFIKDTVDLI